MAKEKLTVEIAHNAQQQVHACSRGDECGLKHDPEKKGEPGLATAQLSTKKLLGKRDPDRKKSFRKGKPANMLRILRGWLSKRHACDHWHPLECSFHQTGLAHSGVSVRLTIRKRLGANQRDERILW